MGGAFPTPSMPALVHRSHNLASVTVIHPSALMADGLSTLLLILGPERAWDYAEKHDIGAFFVIRADTGFVTRTSTLLNDSVAEKPTD
jgi:thiamine biosynthesis lipoprotein